MGGSEKTATSSLYRVHLILVPREEKAPNERIAIERGRGGSNRKTWRLRFAASFRFSRRPRWIVLFFRSWDGNLSDTEPCGGRLGAHLVGKETKTAIPGSSLPFHVRPQPFEDTTWANRNHHIVKDNQLACRSQFIPRWQRRGQTRLYFEKRYAIEIKPMQTDGSRDSPVDMTLAVQILDTHRRPLKRLLGLRPDLDALRKSLLDLLPELLLRGRGRVPGSKSSAVRVPYQEGTRRGV